MGEVRGRSDRGALSGGSSGVGRVVVGSFGRFGTNDYFDIKFHFCDMALFLEFCTGGESAVLFRGSL